MTHIIKTMMLALGATMLLGACSQEEVQVYDAANDGVYFAYDSPSSLSTSINFGDYILGNPQSLPVTINLKVMGLKANTDRRVVLKTKPVEGAGPLRVECPEVVFTPDTIEKTITVQVMRPAERDSDYAAVVYIDSTSQTGLGVKNYLEYTIYAKESYSKPKNWTKYGMFQMYLGDWSVDKHIFLVNLTKNNNYFSREDYYSLVKWNVDGIDSLRTWQKEHPDETSTVDLPFVNEQDFVYPKPWYWNDLMTKYLGAYKSGTFAAVCSALGVKSNNEYQTFNTDENGMRDINKIAVQSMMKQYNQYYYDGWRRGSTYKSNYYVPMFADIDYDVVKPAPWGDTQGGAAKVKKYYGEYSDEKYKFMIRVWLQKQGKNFVLNQMFPIMNEWGSVSWDSSLGGENRMKTCNKLFREAMAGGSYNFTFPTIN